MDSVLVGIDIGTSSAKTVVLSQSGAVLGVATYDYPVHTPKPGWAEQNPDTWVKAAQATVRAALAQSEVSRDAVAAVGLSGQMHGTVCVSVDGTPLRPAIIWADQRSGAQVERVVHQVGRERLAEWTGNPLATGFMLASWLWLNEHEPDVARATRWVLLPKDYVRYRLTGEVGTEPSDAASTSLFNPASRAWSTPLLRALDVREDLLPPVRPSAEIAGGLLPEAAEAMNLPPGTPVIFGGSDQALQALGNGVVDPGTVSSTIGTGGQLFAPTDCPVIDLPKLRLHSYCHVLKDRWHVETAMLAAGLSLRWLRDEVLLGTSYGSLADTAASVPAGAEGLLFQPYLIGERTPHMDSHARASFVGLTLRHGRAHLARAVMEGVVFGMRQGLDLMAQLGVPAQEIVASGGATKHPLWLQLQADIYGRPVRRRHASEAAATGAAMLAGMGAGLLQDAHAAIAAAVCADDAWVMPDPARRAAYEERYRAYCDLYPALIDVMHRLEADAGSLSGSPVVFASTEGRQEMAGRNYGS